MIVGLGTDIVEIARIEHLWKRQGLKFAQRLLTPPEMQELEKSAQPVHFLAKRWAAKEALAKALGTGIAQGVSFQDMTVVHNSMGQPGWSLTGETLRLMTEKNAQAYLSISDEQHYAVATVILESKS